MTDLRLGLPHGQDAAIAAMWPGGQRRLSRRPVRTSSLLVLPSRSRVRLLVPADVPGAETMLERHASSAVRSSTYRLMAWGLRHGLLARLPFSRLVPAGDAAAGLEALAREAVPSAAAVGVAIGPPRPNSKPVLRVFDEQGRTVAFGKVGYSPLTRALVRRESETLTDLARIDLGRVRVPPVLFTGEWNGLDVLLLGALPGARSRAMWELPVDATRDVWESEPLTTSAVSGSACAAGITAALHALPPGELAGAARRSAEAALAAAGPVTLSFGRWHGDWAPWNLSISTAGDGAVFAWDWERSSGDMPAGADAIHWLVQRLLSTGGHRDDGSTLLGWTDRYLRDLGDADQRRATVLVYLAHVLARYAGGAGTSPSAALHTRLARLGAVAETMAGNEWGDCHVIA